MQTKKQKLINTPLFIGAIGALLSGYFLMALIPIEPIRLTLSPILIIIGFILTILSIVIPQKV